jgi:dinuclear metal center YbgI/SA1388 family protein
VASASKRNPRGKSSSRKPDPPRARPGPARKPADTIAKSRPSGEGHAVAPRVARPAEASVRELLAAVERITPLSLAAEWDNVGLLLGSAAWPAQHVRLALDLTDAVADDALRDHVDALLVYHPPFLKGITTVSPEAEASTSRLPDLLAAKVSVVAVHTALDAAVGGTNDAILDCFDTTSRHPLEPLTRETTRCKLVTFVPARELDRVRAALAAAGAGVIGAYSECSFTVAGRGSFRGDASTRPAVGRRENFEQVDEQRLEMVLPRARVAAAVRALCAAHPYEEPAFDIYPLVDVADRGAAGMGRVGVLASPVPGRRLIDRLRRRFDLSRASVVGNLDRNFTSVTAAAGSFGVRSFRDTESLVVTGEFKHHDALDLLRRGVCAVHLGHFASEKPALDALARRMQAALPDVTISVSRADRCPLAELR